MKIKKGDIVKRLYDIEYKTNLLWEIKNFVHDGIGNLVVKIENIINNEIEYCYPEQLKALEKYC